MTFQYNTLKVFLQKKKKNDPEFDPCQEMPENYFFSFFFFEDTE